MPAYTPLTPEIISRIEQAVNPSRVMKDHDRRCEYGKDAGEVSALPELIVEAESAAQVEALLALANEYRFPVTPRGLGTGVAGGAVPLFGGVVLSLARMNRILSIERENLIAVVEPGVVNMDLREAVRREGLFYPPDPASLDTCSIGGNAATNAGGPSCLKYGTTRDYILGVEAVLPTGEKINAGVQTRKGVVGYDLLRLLVGSEGTLGVITKLILKLIPQPQAVTTMVAVYDGLEDAMRAVTGVLTGGHIPCSMEFLDRRCLELSGDIMPFPEARDGGAFLIIECDGIQAHIEREIEEIGVICADFGALTVAMAPDSQRRTKMWDIRREVALRIEEGAVVYIPADIVVPLGRIAEFVMFLPDLERRFGIRIFTFGHAGDGNIHVNVTASAPEMRMRAEEGVECIIDRVLSMGGTMSGEHGVGIAKKRFIHKELSPASIRLQRGIKRLFDPRLILNPGKIFDDE
ncbi:MAG: FAD-binding protein [Deltaproteobacteria bacterium]|nr:FAD-binding protein [Deltaproteobacteria bacterium]